jgi:hypothetical protein
LLTQALLKSRVNFRLLHFSFQQIAQSLALLDIQGKLSLVLLDLGKLEGLLQISKFSVALIDELVDFLELLFESLDRAVIRWDWRSLLNHWRPEFLLVLDFTLLELCEEVVQVLAARTP